MAQPVDEALYLAAIARIYRGSNVIGVAFFVAEGYLLTCAHVVAKALGYNRRSYQIPAADIVGKDLTIEFRLGDAETSAEAQVIYWRCPDHDPRSDNNVAVLKLQEAMPTGAQHFSLMPSSGYWNQDFRVLGFPSKLDPGGWATGTIRQQPGVKQMQKVFALGSPPSFQGSALESYQEVPPPNSPRYSQQGQRQSRKTRMPRQSQGTSLKGL